MERVAAGRLGAVRYGRPGCGRRRLHRRVPARLDRVDADRRSPRSGRAARPRRDPVAAAPTCRAGLLDRLRRPPAPFAGRVRRDAPAVAALRGCPAARDRVRRGAGGQRAAPGRARAAAAEPERRCAARTRRPSCWSWRDRTPGAARGRPARGHRDADVVRLVRPPLAPVAARASSPPSARTARAPPSSRRSSASSTGPSTRRAEPFPRALTGRRPSAPIATSPRRCRPPTPGGRVAAGVARADVGGGDRHRRARRDRRARACRGLPDRRPGARVPARRSASGARRSSTRPRPASTSRWEIASPTRARRSACTST